MWYDNFIDIQRVCRIFIRLIGFDKILSIYPCTTLKLGWLWNYILNGIFVTKSTSRARAWSWNFSAAQFTNPNYFWDCILWNQGVHLIDKSKYLGKRITCQQFNVLLTWIIYIFIDDTMKKIGQMKNFNFTYLDLQNIKSGSSEGGWLPPSSFSRFSPTFLDI